MRLSPIVLLAAIASVSACNDSLLVTPSNTGESRLLAEPGSAQRANALRADEAWLRDLAAAEPSFAGAHLVNGELRVDVTDIARGQHVAQLARTRLAMGGRMSTVGAIRRAQFRFSELSSWRDAVSVKLLELGSWSSLDLNEADNRIDIGVPDEGARQRTLAMLRQERFPPAAFRIFLAAPAEKQATLRDRMRPLRGGIGINPWHRPPLDPESNCTLGFIARWNNQNVLVTASHCTENTGELDGTPNWMKQPIATSSRFGPELSDRGWIVCGTGGLYGPIALCRGADAAIYSTANVDLAAGETSRAAVGQIAKPIAKKHGYLNQASTIEVDPTSPLYVVGTRESPVTGETVHRIGATSGWQYGQVTATCVDHFEGFGTWMGNVYARVLKCQTTAETNSDYGDSGGPIFSHLSGNLVLLAGVNWGSKPHPDDHVASYFSSLAQIRADYSQHAFTFIADSLPTPPPSAIVQGPSYLEPGQYGEWTVSISGATAPFTYAWSINGQSAGNESWVGTTFIEPASMQSIWVTVTDAWNRTFSAAMAVNVGPGNSCAPEVPDCQPALRDASSGIRSAQPTKRRTSVRRSPR